MEDGQVKETTEQLPNSDLCEADEKLKVRGGPALLEAMRDGILNLVNEARGKKDGTKGVDKLNEAGLAPLHKAAQNDQTESVKSLLDQGADIDVQTGEDKFTPLHIAAR